MSRIPAFTRSQSEWLRSSVDVILDSSDQQSFFSGMQIPFMGGI
jgi:hypothetical protein